MPAVRTTLSALLGVCCLAAGVPTTVAAPPVTEGAVPGADKLAPFFEAAATRRVDVVGIGDSNQIFGGHGWDHGLILALDDRFGTWATSLLALGENQGNGSGTGIGFQVNSTASSGRFLYTGAPPALDIALRRVPMFGPLGYLYLPDGQAISLPGHGLGVEASGPIDLDAALTFSTHYGVSPSAQAGTFRPFVRRGSAPFSTVLSAPAPLETTSPTPEVREAVVDIPAASRPFSMQFMLGPPNTALTGPFVAYYMRVAEAESQRGISFSTLYGVGGQSARDMARALIDVPDETLTLYFGALREDQGATPKILIRLNTGLNDRNEGLAAIGAPPFPPADAPASFERNVHAIIDRLHDVWDLNAWPREELYFLFAISHPVGPESNEDMDLGLPDDAELIAYRAVARSIAGAMPRAATVEYDVLTSPAELSANLWYRNRFADRAHLTIGGYEALAARELAALQNGRTWFDADADGRVDAEDLYAFESAATPLPLEPTDASAEGLRAAVRFLELSRSQTGRD